MKKAMLMALGLFTFSALASELSITKSTPLEFGLSSSYDDELMVFQGEHRRVNIAENMSQKTLMQLMSMQNDLVLKYDRKENVRFVCEAVYKEEHYIDKYLNYDYLISIHIKQLANCKLKKETPKESISDLKTQKDIDQKASKQDYSKASQQ